MHNASYVVERITKGAFYGALLREELRYFLLCAVSLQALHFALREVVDVVRGASHGGHQTLATALVPVQASVVAERRGVAAVHGGGPRLFRGCCRSESGDSGASLGQTRGLFVEG